MVKSSPRDAFDPQPVIQYAYDNAVVAKKCWYVYSNGNTFVATKNQPSKYRSHWRIHPDGECDAYVKPDGEPATIAYEPLPEAVS